MKRPSIGLVSMNMRLCGTVKVKLSFNKVDEGYRFIEAYIDASQSARLKIHKAASAKVRLCTRWLEAAGKYFGELRELALSRSHLS